MLGQKEKQTSNFTLNSNRKPGGIYLKLRMAEFILDAITYIHCKNAFGTF